MKALFEEYYQKFILSVKKYICSNVKMDEYQDFFQKLNIQLLALKNGDNDLKIKKDSDNSLLNENQLAQNYLVKEDSVKEINISSEDAFFCGDTFIRKKSGVITSDSGESPYYYVFYWFVDNASSFGFAEGKIAETILDILSQRVDKTNFMETAPEDKPLGKVSFMEEYYKVLKMECNLPERELLSKISVSSYEHRENRGIMCFVEKQKLEGLEGLVEFSGLSIDDEGVTSESIDYIRKLLEISKPSYEGDKNKCLLFSTSEKKQCWGLILEEIISKKADWPIIYFDGANKWKLKYKETVVFQCNDNDFSFNPHSWESNIRDQLPDGLEADIFVNLIKCLEKQQHGALVIIAKDAKKEMKRLCDRYKRGTRIEPFELKDENTLNIISGFCSVDGAIFIDFKGRCHGYGVILDGKAKIKGVRGRGARYNSALNYITNTGRYAIVVSEDKDKEIRFLPEN